MKFSKIVLILVFLCTTVAAQTPRKFTLVIDPGHGGKQPGAVSGKLLEKDLNLAIARRFGKLVADSLPDVRVIYTRSDDREIGLAQRGDIANKANADLFFSIHTNASSNPAANGHSTYVLGMHKNEDNLREAMRENEVIKFEDDYSATYEGFDPSSAESYIVFQLMQYAHFDHSLALARTVQRHYAKNTPMRDRGAAQGGFLVLWKPAMPSVLTEVGFISNATDRAYISSAKGQTAIAFSLFEAFKEYKTALQTENIAALTPASTPKPAAKPAEKPATKPAAPTVSAPKTTPTGTYYVQLFTSRTKVTKLDTGVIERRIDGWYKYCTGPYATRDEAVRARDIARKKYKDAFITR